MTFEEVLDQHCQFFRVFPESATLQRGFWSPAIPRKGSGAGLTK